MKKFLIYHICPWFFSGLALLIVLLLPLRAYTAVIGTSVLHIQYDAPLIVGDTYPATLYIENDSSGIHSSGPVEVTGIWFTPSCGENSWDGKCFCAAGYCDPDVFEIVEPIEGTSGACGGCAFTTTLVDVSGEYLLTPEADCDPLILGPSSYDPKTKACEISFKLRVLKLPDIDSDQFPCLQTTQLSRITLLHPLLGDYGTGSGLTHETVTFFCKPIINMTSVPIGSVPVGTELHNCVTVIPRHNACNPTGTVTFNLFSLEDPDYSDILVFTETSPLEMDQACTRTGYISIEPLTYKWLAEYSGNECNQDAIQFDEVSVKSETETITNPTPISGKIGTLLNNCAIVMGTEGSNPTGMVTFRLFPPGDPDCSGMPAFIKTEFLIGNEACTKTDYTVNECGTYHWTAEYNGDKYHFSSESLCEGGPVIIKSETEIIMSTNTVSDQAGALLNNCANVVAPQDSDPTGTVTFRLYPPGEDGCSGTPVHIETVPLVGGQACTMTGCIVNEPGTYNWTAVYNADTHHLSSASLFVNLSAGWSMISLPVETHDATVSAVFPEALVMYSFEKESGYVRVKEEEKLQFGIGYWIKLDHNHNCYLTGQCINSYIKTEYKDGWEMIGGCISSAKASADGCKISVIYGLGPNGYQRIPESENLEPGRGYWIKYMDILDQCKLTVGCI